MARTNAGRPVRRRDLYNGDITALGRIRTAVAMDMRTPRDKQREVLVNLDKAIASLVELNEIIAIRKTA